MADGRVIKLTTETLIEQVEIVAEKQHRSFANAAEWLILLGLHYLQEQSQKTDDAA